ncbi:MAG: hypothetical protein OHK0029_31810 [Armatimonadaceae bacterium]
MMPVRETTQDPPFTRGEPTTVHGFPADSQDKPADNSSNLEDAGDRLRIREDAIPGYRLLKEVGRGGMGVVYKAVRLSEGDTVALKILLGGRHTNETNLRRFQTENKAASRLNHPHIVKVFGSGTADGVPFLAMEYCPNGTLQDRIQDQPQDPERAAEIVRTIAHALYAAHKQGIIHRDIKPGNVLIAADGTYKLADFGLAKQLDAEGNNTQTGMILGSLGYMAPEQAAGKTHQATHATDIYSLGALLYKLLTGKPPFQGTTDWDTVEQIVKNEAVSVLALQPKVPRDLATICHKCLEKQPGRRYHSVQALADDLSRFLEDEPIFARPISFAERAARWSRRHPSLTATIAAGAAALILVGSMLAWGAYRSHRMIQSVQALYLPRQETLGQLRYAQEALTASAFLAASTGKTAWLMRYQETAPRMKQALIEAKRLVPEAQRTVGAMEEAHRILLRTETEALNAARRGENAAAWSWLNTPQYFDARLSFQRNLDEYTEALSRQQQEFLTRAERETDWFFRVAALMAGLAVALCAGIGLLTLHLLRRIA